MELLLFLGLQVYMYLIIPHILIRAHYYTTFMQILYYVYNDCVVSDLFSIVLCVCVKQINIL